MGGFVTICHLAEFHAVLLLTFYPQWLTVPRRKNGESGTRNGVRYRLKVISGGREVNTQSGWMLWVFRGWDGFVSSCYSFSWGFFLLLLVFLISLAWGIFLLRPSQRHELRIPRPSLFYLSTVPLSLSFFIGRWIGDSVKFPKLRFYGVWVDVALIFFCLPCGMDNTQRRHETSIHFSKDFCKFASETSLSTCRHLSHSGLVHPSISLSGLY